MDSDDTTDDSGRNLMHKQNDAIRIGKNTEVTQHDPDFENENVGDDEEHLEAPHCPILVVNVTSNNDRIRNIANLLEVHTRSRPHSSFAQFDRNCPKQQIIFNRCDKLDLKTLKRGQELYTDPCGIDID